MRSENPVTRIRAFRRDAFYIRAAPYRVRRAYWRASAVYPKL